MGLTSISLSCVNFLFVCFAWLLLVLIIVFPMATAITPHMLKVTTLRYYDYHPDTLMDLHLGLYSLIGNICYL